MCHIAIGHFLEARDELLARAESKIMNNIWSTGIRNADARGFRATHDLHGCQKVKSSHDRMGNVLHDVAA